MPKWSRILSLILFFTYLSCPPSITASATTSTDNIKTITLTLSHKPLYVTCCDLAGNGLKDIITADTNDITIFRQKQNLSFEPYSIKSNDRIMAVNAARFSKTRKENILCLGENKIFYFSLNSEGSIEGPTYINLPKNHPAFIEKQKNLKNYSFVIDMNNDGLDDIAIPCEDGLYFLWQEKPAVFKPFYLQFVDVSINSSLNISPWPKVGNSMAGHIKGVSFFPTFTKKQTYWIQDYNKDGLLDVISLTECPDGYVMAVYLQNNGSFEKPIYVKLQNAIDSKRNIDEMRLIDINNDGFLDIVESKIEYPLHENESLLPVISTKIYIAHSLFQFDSTPKYIFKTVFIPGLDNIVDLDHDGRYEIVTSASPLKFGTKESIIKIATNKEIDFNLNYFNIGNGGHERDIQINKTFTMSLPGLDEIDTFNRFIRLDDINNDGIVDIILLKKNSLLEIDLLKKDNNALSINKTMDVSLPCPASEIIPVDINTDGKKEFLVLEPSGKKIYIISIKSL